MKPINPIKIFAAHAKGALSGNHYHIRIHMPSTTPTTPNYLKWLEPFINDLHFLEPMIKHGSQGVIVGIAMWKFQASSEEFREYANEHFRLMEKQIKVEEQKTQLMKDIAATHKDLGFFLKMWRKSWEESEDAQDGK